MCLPLCMTQSRSHITITLLRRPFLTKASGLGLSIFGLHLASPNPFPLTVQSVHEERYPFSPCTTSNILHVFERFRLILENRITMDNTRSDGFRVLAGAHQKTEGYLRSGILPYLHVTSWQVPRYLKGACLPPSPGSSVPFPNSNVFCSYFPLSPITSRIPTSDFSGVVFLNSIKNHHHVVPEVTRYASAPLGVQM